MPKSRILPCKGDKREEGGRGRIQRLNFSFSKKEMCLDSEVSNTTKIGGDLIISKFGILFSNGAANGMLPAQLLH